EAEQEPGPHAIVWNAQSERVFEVSRCRGERREREGSLPRRLQPSAGKLDEGRSVDGADRAVKLRRLLVVVGQQLCVVIRTAQPFEPSGGMTMPVRSRTP